MLTNYYDKIVVKIEYGEYYGSGVLISDVEDKSSFLISARHCFGKQTEISYQEISIFQQEESVLKKISLHFQDIIILEQEDIVIFEIDYLENIPQYQIVCPKSREKVVFAGFPNGLNGKGGMVSRYKIGGEVNELPNSSIIQVNSDRSFETYFSDAKKNMSGYSGSGIFVEDETTLYLCGIVTQLGSEEGVFSFVNGISIITIDSALYQAKKKHLPNIEWCSFGKFVESTLKIFEEPLANICSVQIPEIMNNVTPSKILAHCGNKIVWPYSDKSLHRQEVWEEWLLYLIIRCIENYDNIKNEDFYVIKKNNRDRKVKVLYATRHIRLPDFLKDYLENAYQDISIGQVMIIKTDTTPATKTLSSKKIEKIVSDISSAISTENHLYIDTVESNIRQISIIHISALIDEMVEFVEQEENEELRGIELEKKLGVRIKEVLYGI